MDAVDIHQNWQAKIITCAPLEKGAAMNAPIQGTAADIIKAAMIHVHETLKKECPQAKLILQVHDELIVDVPRDQAEKVKKILTDC